MVARRGSHDLRVLALLSQDRDPVERSPDLKRAGALEVLRLHEHRAAEQLGKSSRSNDRRRAHHAPKARRGLFDLALADDH
jgi:hypothetical protein